MAQEKAPHVIKKYANRRLYHTGTSAYVTLEDLAEMVKGGDDFIVNDAKTGEDITHSVLTQIIFEQESKGQNLLPIKFLRQMIRFYGDSMQSLVPRYLDMSMDRLKDEQGSFREHMSKTFGAFPVPDMEEQVRANMALFTKTLSAFVPFPVKTEIQEPTPAKPAERDDELTQLKRELRAMKTRIDKLDDR